MERSHKQAENRQIKFYTGTKGMDQFNKTLKRTILKNQVDHLHLINKVTDEEHKGIVLLIEGTIADQTVAEVILETKEKN